MAAALIAHDTHRVTAHFLGGVGKTGVGNFVHDHAARPLQQVHEGLGGAARRLNDADFLVHDGLQKALDGAVGLGVGQEGQVHGKGLVRQALEPLDVLLKVLRVSIGRHIDRTQAPGVGDGSGQVGLGKPLHGALNDGILNAEQLCDAGLHGAGLLLFPVGSRPTFLFCNPFIVATLARKVNPNQALSDIFPAFVCFFLRKN